MGSDRILSLRMTEDQYREAQEKAEANGMPLADLVRKLLSDDTDTPTLKQIRIDIDRLRQDISYLQYSLELIMAADEEMFGYLLRRIPAREIGGSRDEQMAVVKALTEESRHITSDCLKKAMERLLRYRADENESEDPLHTREFESSLLKKREEAEKREA